MRNYFSDKRIPLSVLLTFLLMSASQARADELADCYVLSAGVDNYPNAGKLMGCLNDARNTTAAFRAQQGRRFGKVHAHTLLDAKATRANIQSKFEEFSQQGKPGDFVVLFLSGHGDRANNQQTWFFLPFDFNPQNPATILTDRHILDLSDAHVKQGKKVVIIIDACFAGQFRITARDYLNRYRNPQAGGLILMLSSSADQPSAALGKYSAFAKAFADSMNGDGDLNRDGKTTLDEIRKYTHEQTHQLLRQEGMMDRQDSELAWSPSISEQMSLARQPQFSNPPAAAQAYLGVQPMPETKVLKIRSITPDSPAAKAGLQANDTILKIDNQKLASVNDLSSFLKARRPGTPITVHVQRANTVVAVPVVLGKRSN